MKFTLLMVGFLSYSVFGVKSLKCFNTDNFDPQNPGDVVIECTGVEVCIRYVEMRSNVSQKDTIGCGIPEECAKIGLAAKTIDDSIEYFCEDCKEDKCIPTVPPVHLTVGTSSLTTQIFITSAQTEREEITTTEEQVQDSNNMSSFPPPPDTTTTKRPAKISSHPKKRIISADSSTTSLALHLVVIIISMAVTITLH